MIEIETRQLRLLLLVNGSIAMLIGAAALVLLLIAPLGLAAVITITVMVTLIAWVAGMIGDWLLLRLLLPKGQGDRRVSAPAARSMAPGEHLPLQDASARRRLPDPRQR